MAFDVFYQAHRGAVDEAPENTMPAFRHAWRYPGAIPETDVRMTADGALVCVHDATLARTTDVSASVADRPLAEWTLAEIQRVDAGIRFGPAFRGARVPVFDDVLAEMACQPGRRLYVEPKAVDLGVLRGKLDAFGVTGQVIFVSGHMEMLAEIQRVFPGAPAMTWAGGPPEAIRARVDQWLASGMPTISQLQLHVQVVQPGPEPVYALDDAYLAQLQRRLQEAGVTLQLRPFQVTAAALRRFLDIGVRWYVTDSPAAFWHDLATALQPGDMSDAAEPIYHITPLREWMAALSVGVYRAASLDTEGFIHCSTRQQALRVADAFFPPGDELVVLCIDPRTVQSTLRYEKPALADDPLVHEQFPHIYGALPLHAVVAVADLLPDASGRFGWPAAFP